MCGRVKSLTIAILCAAFDAASADDVTLTVNLDGTPLGGTYSLIGQSATLLTRTGGSSSGGQLDGVSTGNTVIGYTEVFPPPQITEYMQFGYFGRVNTFNLDPGVPDDTSLIVALQPGVAIGQRIGQIFPGMIESTLVTAFDTFDSPEYFEFLDAVLANSSSLGTVELPTVPRAGDTLDLIAFIGGADGSRGVKIGDFHFAIVPEPAAGLGLLLLGAMGIARRVR